MDIFSYIFMSIICHSVWVKISIQKYGLKMTLRTWSSIGDRFWRWKTNRAIVGSSNRLTVWFYKLRKQFRKKGRMQHWGMSCKLRRWHLQRGSTVELLLDSEYFTKMILAWMTHTHKSSVSDTGRPVVDFKRYI